MRGRLWSAEDLATLRRLYPSTRTEDLALQLGRSLSCTYNTARKLGLAKSAEYLASPEACRLRRGDNVGVAHRFKPGSVPFNKGVKMPGWAPGRMAETQFKPGQIGNKYMPIGSERVSKDGYLERKVTDHHGSPRDWRGVHIVVWEAANGPLPAGHAVTFRDRNKANRVLENLELVSRAELMRRNSSQRWGPEVFQLIQLRGALNRQIRKRDEEQNVRPAQPSVCNA